MKPDGRQSSFCMPFSEEHISSVNRAQAISESDSFTQARYCQMFRHFPARVRNVLDVGCNTGRGGAVLKSLDPGIGPLRLFAGRGFTL